MEDTTRPLPPPPPVRLPSPKVQPSDLPPLAEPERLTFAVQHPDMSHALLIDSDQHRTQDALAAWGSLYMLQRFDVMLAPAEFRVRWVPQDTPDDFSLFGDPS